MAGGKSLRERYDAIRRRVSELREEHERLEQSPRKPFDIARHEAHRSRLNDLVERIRRFREDLRRS